MEVVLGALPSLLPKLGELLSAEYNLQKEVKGGVRFLQAELESMKAALEDISNTPADKIPTGDKFWARNVRELSYDIEDSIDTFMVQVKGSKLPKNHGFKKFIDKILGSLMQPKIRHRIAVDIRDIKSRVIEVHKRHRRYEFNHVNDKPVKVDTRALVRYEKMENLVGINEARDEVIKILNIEGNEMSKKKDKVVSIVGFGGLGKTTLANVVYQQLRGKYECSAFVSVTQTPDMDKLLKDIFFQLAKYNSASVNIIDELREFLQNRSEEVKGRYWYFIVIDDIWEISYWNMLRCALPDDNDKYRIITTTRNFTVAEQIGGAYKMKPLSLENSRALMYGRIFGKEDKDKCLDEQLVEVSNRILKKCAGVPLAIITIASLLVSKGKNKLEWYDVCNSIGAGLEENNTVDNMRNVLSLSYYDMPSHLRTCLLYLGMFPEDYIIGKDRLIWLWIAEGFIQSGKQERSLLELGESYLNELINRSMIQPIYDTYSRMVESCHVHDMVLELLGSLSSEENFITIRNGVGNLSASEKIRRLSLQNGKASQGKHEAIMSIEHVRSVAVFPHAIDHIHVPTLQNFKVLRVLDLQDCDLSQGYSLKYLGNLIHLRYLGLRNTAIDQLPGEIGNLRFLQTLDAQGNAISTLPSTIVLLSNLRFLAIDESTRVPKGIGSLTTLEHLSMLGISNDSTDIIAELGNLTELKVLKITYFLIEWNNGLDKSLVECLDKLHKIQSLYIKTNPGDCNLDGWVAITPQRLRTLKLVGCWLSTLPAWVDPSLLLNLSYLYIKVRGLQQEDLEILGRLPALCSLYLMVDHESLGIHGRFNICAGMFPCLVRCGLYGFGGPVVFQEGAMPRLAELTFQDFDFGLNRHSETLPSLQYVRFWFESGGASEEEVEEAKATVRHAIEVHPNHPTLHIFGDEPWKDEDDGAPVLLSPSSGLNFPKLQRKY